MHLALDWAVSRDQAGEVASDAQHVEAVEFGFFMEHANQGRDAKAAISLPQGSVNENEMSVHLFLSEVFENDSQ